MEKTLGGVLFKGVLVCVITVMIILTNNSFLGSAQGAGEKELVVVTWGGASLEGQKKAFFDPFTKETGIKIVTPVAGGDLMGKVAVQVKAGNVEWDVIWPTDIAEVESAGRKGMLEEIDYSIVTDTKNLYPGSVTKWGVGCTLSCYVIAYNEKVYPRGKHPKSWADYYDGKEFPGSRADHARWAPLTHFVTALLADGVPLDKLVPIDYDRAFKKLDQIKPHVKVWYTTGDQVMQVLLDKEAVLAHTTDTRANKAREMGATVDIEYNQGLSILTYWSVVKGTPHKEAAMKFINFVMRPDLQGVYTDSIGSSGPNLSSFNYVNPDLRKRIAIYPDNVKRTINPMTDKAVPWFIEHLGEMAEKWNTWLSK